MNTLYFIIFLIIIGLFIFFGFCKAIKFYHYELNFRESLFLPILALAFTFIHLLNFNSSKIYYIEPGIYLAIFIYGFTLPLIYYIIRAIKLREYIPTRIFFNYIPLFIIYLSFLFILFSVPGNLGNWDRLGIFIINTLACIIYIILLLLINTILLISRSVNPNPRSSHHQK